MSSLRHQSDSWLPLQHIWNFSYCGMTGKVSSSFVLIMRHGFIRMVFKQMTIVCNYKLFCEKWPLDDAFEIIFQFCKAGILNIGEPSVIHGQIMRKSPQNWVYLITGFKPNSRAEIDEWNQQNFEINLQLSNWDDRCYRQITKLYNEG